MVLFLTLFVLIFLPEPEYANPPGMKAPWAYGIAYKCAQGNGEPISHDIPYTYYSWDFDMPAGTPVLAAAAGEVRVVGYTGTDGYGDQVRIRHANGSYALYAHLSQPVVRVGQHVKQGQLIGYSGSTGYSNGPHLHFSIVDHINTSLPSRFSDIGIPVRGEWCTSRNGIPRRR